MKVLLVGLERVGKQFSMESLFKKKLTEARHDRCGGGNRLR